MTKRPLHPLGAAGLALFLAGLGAWLWLGEWRWALSGFLLMLVLAIVGATIDARKGSGQ